MPTKFDRKFKGDYAFILNSETLFITSPIPGLSIEQYHRDVLRYAELQLNEEEYEKLNQKYNELEKRLYSEKYNPNYREAEILKNVECGKEDLRKFDKESLFALYQYFVTEYSKQLCYKKKFIANIKDKFNKVITKDTFEGVYNLSYNQGVTNWIKDVLGKKHNPTDEELIEVEDRYKKLGRIPKLNIRKIYREVISTGGSLEIGEKNTEKEITKLAKLIEDQEFVKKYNREFDLVDLYLTTNLKPEDILINLYDNGTVGECKIISLWTERMLKHSLKASPVLSKPSWYNRLCEPPLRVINEFQNDDFSEYYAVNHDEEDLLKAYTTLYDLNQKYGVKFDQYNYLYILKQVVFKNEESYYAVAEEYKNELDKLTHIENHNNPVLTRRVKNK